MLRYRIAAWSLALFLIVPAAVCAQEQLDCANSESFFCDDTWRGGAAFYAQIEKWGYSVDYRRTMQSDEKLSRADDVYIWISPSPQIIPKDLAKFLADGAKILVFDESDASLSWYREFVNPVATSEIEYQSGSAAHINDNPELPVFYVDSNMRSMMHVSAPDDDSTWLIAMNHPTPIVETDLEELSGYHGSFYYMLPDAPEIPGGGRLIVIRDESFPIRLMLDTLDNRKLLSALIGSLCSGACRLHLYEPGFDYICAADTDSEPELSLWERFTDAIASSELITRLRDIWNDDELMGRVNWRFFFITILVAWLVLALLLAMPLRRNNV